MSNNRLSRNDILNDALDMVDSQALDLKDRPGGTLVPAALSIRWLQRGLDIFHRAFPWSGTITTGSLSLTTSTNTVALPSDFVMDKRDGIKIVQTSPAINRRLLRKSLDWLLDQNATATATGEPGAYVIIGTNVTVVPWPKTSYTATLWYYKLPAALAPNERPNFPDDEVLVEYVHLCGKAWTGEKEPGVAMAYAKAMIDQLRKSGIGEESEVDALPLDRDRFRPSGSGWASDAGWMGDAVPNL